MKSSLTILLMLVTLMSGAAAGRAQQATVDEFMLEIEAIAVSAK